MTDTDRRTLLKLGAAGAVLGGAATTLPATSAAAATAPAAWPQGVLGAAAAKTVDPAQFLSTQVLAGLGQELNALGLRATGSDVHEAYVVRLAEQLRQAGVSEVTLEPVPIKRWSARSWSLSVGGQVLPHTYYVPSSKATGPAGLSAPLVYVPKDKIGSIDVKGKIAVFDVAYTGLPLLAFRAISYNGAYTIPAGDDRDQNGSYLRPWLNGIADTLDTLAERGAVGTVGVWPDLPGEWAKQYTPYDGVFRPIPGLWIDRDAGAGLKKAAATGATARIELQADVVDTTTHNIVGHIPGRSSELTVLHTHTDGTNGMEENGQIGILAAAQYLTRLPRASLDRTVMIMLSTGHFAGGLGIQYFLRQHASDLVPRITSVLTLEHLGTLEYLPTARGTVEATGAHELGVYFTAAGQGLVDAVKAGLKRDGIAGSVVRPFVPRLEKGVKQNLGWPGEGQYFWVDGGLFASNFITGPYGLITADLDVSGMVDYAQVRRHAMSAVLTVLQLAAASRSQISAWAF